MIISSQNKSGLVKVTSSEIYFLNLHCIDFGIKTDFV